LAIQGIEWIIVAVIVLVFFLWGPEKLPKFARSIGQARREFEKASKGIEEEVTRATVQTPTTSDEKIIEIARSMGIQTLGKTRDEIVQEILAKAQKPS